MVKPVSDHYEIKDFWVDINHQEQEYGMQLLRFIVEKSLKENKNLKAICRFEDIPIFEKLMLKDPNKDNSFEAVCYFNTPIDSKKIEEMIADSAKR